MHAIAFSVFTVWGAMLGLTIGYVLFHSPAPQPVPSQGMTVHTCVTDAQCEAATGVPYRDEDFIK